MNWKQELAQATNAIEGLNRCTATITYKVEAGSDFYTDTATTYTLTRTINIKAPAQVNAKLVDGINYKSGDLIARASYADMQAANSAQESDPPMNVDGRYKTLPDFRPFTASGNWGVELGVDTLTIGGDQYMIVGVVGLMWLDNEPSLIDLTLRR